ncbi:hypothetical protein BH11ARM2_BH11ARM2_33600 [soil metagenome]
MKRSIAFLLSVVAATTSAQQAVLTQHNDNLRTGAVLTETKLNTTNVRVGKFGKLFTRKVDGQLYAQPLYYPKLQIGDKVRNVVYCATMHDSVYAFDANDPVAEKPLWHRSFINGTTITTIPFQDLVGWADITPEIGILSTPVIDPANGTMYLVVRTLEGDPNVDTNYKQRLYALDIKTGKNKRNPVELSGTFPGNGDQSNGQGMNVYNGRRQNQRPAITLANGRLYIASASHGDTRPYHGWILAYDEATLNYVGAFNTTPNGGLGGLWMSGQGPAIDEQGNLYVITGNGPFDPSVGNYGDSVLKLDKDLNLLDYFTPFNQANLENWDEDLGSVGLLLIPGTDLALAGSKESKFYLMNRSNMGKFHAGDDSNVRQWVYAGAGHIHGAPVYYNGPAGRHVYVWSEGDHLKSFGITDDDLLTTEPTNVGQVIAADGMPGAFLSVSANFAQPGTGIVWASLPRDGNANQQTVPGVLRAYDAATLEEIWNSRENPVTDDVGMFAKYSPPTVADGQVFLGTFSGELAVYGLIPAHKPAAPLGLDTQPGESRVKLTWKTTPLATSFDVLRGPKGGTLSKIKSSVTATTYTDLTGEIGVSYDYAVRARNAYGQSENSSVVTAASMAPLFTAALPASGDAYVGVGAMATKNFGKDGVIILDANSASRYRYGFIKFNLANLPKGEIAQAKLVMTGSRIGDTVSNDDLFTVDDDWDENTLTWDNMPRFQQLLGTVQVDKTVAPREWDVTAYLKSLQAGGAPQANFGLVMQPRGKEEPDTYNGKRIVDTFFSREAKANQPTLVVSTRPVINLAAGFTKTTNLTFQGTSKLADGHLRLIDYDYSTASSTFWTTKMQVDRFRTKFRFQITDPGADGLMFVIQANATNAVGPSGGGLGFGPDTSGNGGGIPKSVGIKWDIYNNSGEGENSTGVYLNGSAPTTPAVDLSGTGIDLHSGHVFDATITYYGPTLHVVTTDTQTCASAAQSYPVDIVGTLGKSIGWVGFTAGAGGLSGKFDILNWTYGL